MNGKEKILIEVVKFYDMVSCEIYVDEFHSVCTDFDNMKQFKNNILKTVCDATGNEKLTKNNLKIKHLNRYE